MSEHIHGFDTSLGKACDTPGGPCENRAKLCGDRKPGMEQAIVQPSCGMFRGHGGEHQGWNEGMKLTKWAKS